MPTYINIKETKLLLSAGVIVKCVVFQSKNDTWALRFVTSAGKDYMFKTRRGELRRFKTLDTAFSLIDELGLERMTVIAD